MRSIPPAIDADAEDVAWALQTADALWNRGERVDAIVWLRRAAQSAGEAEDDDRALELARQAAELAEWIASNPAGAPLPASAEAVLTTPPEAGEAVDDLLREPDEDRPKRNSAIEMGSDIEDDPADDQPTPIQPRVEEPDVVFSVPPVAPGPPRPRPSPRPAPPPSPIPPSPNPARVLTAAEAHAGMLDPWAEHEAPTRNQALPPEGAPAPAPPPPPPPPVPAPPEFDSDEVVTSAPPVSARAIETRALEAKAAPPPAPPVRPPAPAQPAATPKAPPPPPRPRPAAPKPPAPPPRADTPAKPAGLDLSEVEALSDLPDDARAAFAAAATLQNLGREDEVSGFALALVLEGAVDLSATIVDAAAERLEAGAVLRARGTIEQVAPVRLVGATDKARVATWDEEAVTEAFRTCPWVEDELRSSGDRLQALVGITMGPLGERLDASLRADVTSRLRVRALAEHEVIATQGTAVPGLVIVGAGQLELLGDDGAPSGKVVRVGEFLFPGETLRAGPAPSTARASRGGALVLVAERGTAQELLVTCPPLLEIFAGM
jgi:hypothetical protein